MSVFDPMHNSDNECKLSDYGTERIKTVKEWYGPLQDKQINGKRGLSEANIDSEYSESKWKLF